jgi:RND family efflux transporter MFP subunit
MRRWAIIVTVLLCLALTASIACEMPDGEANQPPVEVVRGDLTVTVSGSGYVEVTKEKQLAFSSGGKIDKLFVEEGDEVSQGDILAALDTSTLELSLIQAKLARDEAEYNLKQLKDVLHSSQDRIKLAESALEAAERAVIEVQKQLDEAVITAPFDGVVAVLTVKEGDIVPPPTMAAQAIIHLIDLTSLELSAEVDEIDIPDVKPGQKAIIEVDALPDDLIEGEVVSISSLPDLQTGLVVYPVKIKFDVPEGLPVKAGMSATADIIIQEKSDVLLVPARVVRENEQGNTVVNVMIGKEIEERVVVTGISNGLQTEIISGLNEGEIVTG